METLHSAKAAGQSSDVLLLDLSAAFATVTTKSSSPHFLSLESQDLPSAGLCPASQGDLLECLSNT